VRSRASCFFSSSISKCGTPCRLRHGWGAAVAESRAEEIPVADLIRAQRRQRVPAGTCRQLSADSGLHGLAARHRDPCGGMVGEIVALAKEIAMLLLDLRLWLRPCAP